MTQDEIDALTRSYRSGEIEQPIVKVSDECRHKYNAALAAKARYEYALSNSFFGGIEEARKNMHTAAFGNWLYKHKMTKREYYRLMNMEAQKRGLRPPFPMGGKA